jgi:carbonic anhydrase
LYGYTHTQENVRLSVKRLLAYPWIKSAVDAGRVQGLGFRVYRLWFRV